MKGSGIFPWSFLTHALNKECIESNQESHHVMCHVLYPLGEWGIMHVVAIVAYRVNVNLP